MKNFKFNNECPSNYPLWDKEFLPVLEITEKKVSISKVSISKSSEEELSKINGPRSMTLPYTLTAEQLHEIFTSTAFILNHFDGLRKDLFLQIKNQVNEIISYNEKEIPKYKIMDLPDSFWKNIFVNDFSNPFIKDICMYKELPQLVDRIIQQDYEKGIRYSLVSYDDYKKFAADFLFAISAKLLGNKTQAYNYMRQEDNYILDNLTFRPDKEQIYKMLVEKINMLKADITEQSPHITGMSM